MELVITAIVALLLGGAIVFIIKRVQDENKKKSARVEADRIVNKAKSEAAKIKKDSETKAKDFESRARKNVEADIHKQKSTLKNKESQLDRRLKEIEDQFKSKMEENERYLNTLKDREEKIAISENRIKDLEKKGETHIGELKQKLESVAAMSQDEARRQLLNALEDEAKQEASKKIAQIEEEASKEADKKAKRILATALSRFASEYTSERTVSVLALPNDEMKGKIIGREGRNIRTLEALCGVDLIVDDTPEAVVISGFDPVRRELARRTIEKLMEDGRVHPARIEEVVEKQRSELMKSIKEEGERHVMELGIPNMHPELIKIIGGLKYRSYQGQNALNQALEVANIAGLLAGEMGVNVKIARRAGLLHNIGKAIDHTAEGSYAFVGADFAKKYNESEDVCHAIRAHDEEEKPHSILAWIVHAAFILSSSRPGARRPQMDSFIHRLEDLESIGNSFDGVLKTLALQAGKDVRVLVESSKVTDDQAVMLSRDIARKIEREMPQAGAVKVTVVRETRSVEHAR
ncbi:ribonuclease Y [Bdellovibrio bacteriovorus]|uniref:Ribonuclease Y n=1 Tax=Bdellovibrio bacteriovorus TaxID=959 RepID=A0A150WKV5_BDEBC|nr:ribonuclease Y [Bdellovibrio bacteriovorus]KYG64610.1 ribonuclease Y [Bdellovibrio bacteriovorus]